MLNDFRLNAQAFQEKLLNLSHPLSNFLLLEYLKIYEQEIQIRNDIDQSFLKTKRLIDDILDFSDDSRIFDLTCDNLQDSPLHILDFKTEFTANLEGYLYTLFKSKAKSDAEFNLEYQVFKAEFDRYIILFDQLFPDLKLRKEEIIGSSLYGYFIKCFDFIQKAYQKYQMQFLKIKNLNINLQDDVFLIYVYQRLNQNSDVVILGGNYNPNLPKPSKIGIYWDYAPDKNFDISLNPYYCEFDILCESVFISPFQLQKDELAMNQNRSLLNYLCEFQKYTHLPYVFQDFLYEYKQTAFVAFAKPYLKLMFEFLSLKVRPYNFVNSSGLEDGYFTMSDAERFLLHLNLNN